MSAIQMVMFDLAGTTIRDENYSMLDFYSQDMPQLSLDEGWL